jgi:hypothetical protein
MFLGILVPVLRIFVNSPSKIENIYSIDKTIEFNSTDRRDNNDEKVITLKEIHIDNELSKDISDVSIIENQASASKDKTQKSDILDLIANESPFKPSTRNQVETDSITEKRNKVENDLIIDNEVLSEKPAFKNLNRFTVKKFISK